MARRSARLALRLAAAAVLALLLAELALRCVLFGAWFDGVEAAQRLRQAGLYAHPQRGDLHWFLSARWEGRGDDSVPGYDPLLGWVGYGIQPPAYDHPDRARLDGRRPVLLYGDSYAQCNTPPEECFQELLEEHPLGKTHHIVNYGMGGYGLDQIYLLMRASLDAWQRDRPLVLVSLMVDDDLDRAILSMRDWPKPRLGLRGGQLVLPERPVPSVRAALADKPFVASYLALRLRNHRISRLWNGYQGPSESAELDAHKQALARALFEAIDGELTGRGIPHPYVLFHSEHSVGHPEVTGWREALAQDVLDALGARWYSASDALMERAEDTRAPIADFFGREGSLIGHYNAAGNNAALDSMVRAISDLEGIAVPRRHPLKAERIHGTRTGEGGFAFFAAGEESPFQMPSEARRLVIVPGRDGPSEIRYDLRRDVERFSARARLLRLGADAPGCGSARLTVLADGEVLFQRTFGPQDAPEDVVIEVAGRALLVLRVDDGGDGPGCDRIVLGSPLFE